MTKSLTLLATIFLSFSSSALLRAQALSESQLYFPPKVGLTWERMSFPETGWDHAGMGEFLSWLESTNTRAFLILKDGKLVVEEYRGNRLTGMGPMDESSLWYWASAGKTLTAALLGIAEAEGLLKLKDRSQKYLGKGWTSLENKEEKRIRIVHQLSMTTGLDDTGDLNSVTPSDLRFRAKAGTRWSYHNAPYTVLKQVVQNASGRSFQDYFHEKIRDRIGMNGLWQNTGGNNVYYSSPRSMARFGLLLLAKGKWEDEQVLNSEFVEQMISPSQDFNPSYGLLTWLNGQSSYRLPGIERNLPGSLVPDAPEDMFMALGKNGQFLMVIPSQNVVIVRMGASSDTSQIPFLLMNQIWERLGPVISGN
ncbi:serine hydrolase [Algoriphagus sp. NF]|uniref:serine hydrolase domain-containing protein n=1 Tax=Algoriphagus sp. NF TaxID=2992756 RepID=UPI00237AA0E9|nr:serine hydrolase [Algoriphagus sp. NF]MDE0559050.1 serine hydrolase [Algoriphagus sp. NF]